MIHQVIVEYAKMAYMVGGHLAAIRTTSSHVTYQLTPAEITNEKSVGKRFEPYQLEKARELNRH